MFDRIQERAKTSRNILQEPAGNVGGRRDDHSVRAKSCCVACLRNLYRELRLSGNDIPGNAFDAHSAAEGVVQRLGKSVDERLVAAAKSDERVAAGGGRRTRLHRAANHAAMLCLPLMRGREGGAQAQALGVSGVNSGDERANQAFQ